MTTSSINITQVKLEVRQIIENLKRLENFEINQANLNELKCNTENILSNLESRPLQNLKRKLKKRQKKRVIKRLKKEKIQKTLNTDIKVSTCSLKSVEISKDTKPKPHHQLKSLHECQRFLKTFELLEQLHLARGQNPRETRKFSAKLQQLKSIWNCLLQEQQQEEPSKNLKIQQQWDEVLFGAPEKMYFQEKPNLQSFITKRQIWDSYIDNKHGSCIPKGWILPSSDADKNWSPYLAVDV